MADRFAEWPDEIGFTIPEIAVLLNALDVAVEWVQSESDLRMLRRAQLVIWRKLWPELADQYDEPEADGEA